MSFIIQPTTNLGTNSAVASGTIPNGATVIMNSDGTVTACGLVSSPNSISLGTAVTVINASINTITSVFDPVSQKVVVVYAISTGTYAIVGTVSGTTITFGTAVLITAFVSTVSSGCFHTTNSTSVFAVNYFDGSNTRGYAFTVSVSGTVPTIGTLYQFSTATIRSISIIYDVNANKCLIGFDDAIVSQFGNLKVATVSGTTITYGTTLVFNLDAANYIALSYDSTALKTVVCYVENNTVPVDKLFSRVATISGTSVTVGTATTISAVTSGYVSDCYDSINNKTVVSFFTTGTPGGYAIIGTVSGTTISFGTAVLYTATTQNYNAICFNPSIGKVDIVFGVSTNNNVIVGTVSGTTITFGTAASITPYSSYNSIIYDSLNQKVVITYASTRASSSVGSIGTATNLTSTNFFGISTAAFASSSTATINTIGSLNSKQTGLTAGSGYYVQNDGTLLTSAGTPSVYAGLATSTTSILLKG